LGLVRAAVAAAAGQEDVQKAVVVEVEQGDAAAQGLQDGELAELLAVVVDVLDARVGRHVAEQGRTRGGGRFGRRGGGPGGRRRGPPAGPPRTRGSRPPARVRAGTAEGSGSWGPCLQAEVGVRIPPLNGGRAAPASESPAPPAGTGVLTQTMSLFSFFSLTTYF